MKTVRVAAAAGVVVAGLLGMAPGVAAAAPIVPFQIDPAIFGNPNGSLDVPPIHCGIERTAPGVITVTGRPKEYGCLVHSWVRWINVSTGRTGASLTSSGLNGIPAEARLHTGAGRVALIVDPRPGTMLTPGLATIDVR